MDVIKVDPILTGKVLNLVNSSYFSMPQRISSLNRALILLGLNTIKNIALSTAIVGSTKSDLKLKEVDELWAHMLAVGVASKMMAARAGHPRKILEEFFVAGLLHDIGDLMLLKFATEKTLNIMQTKEQNFLNRCQNELGITGPECGKAVIEHWKLPAVFSEVVQHRQSAPESSSPLIQTIHYADHLTSNLDFGIVLTPMDQPLPKMDHIQLSEADIKEIINELPSEVEKAKVFISQR